MKIVIFTTMLIQIKVKLKKYQIRRDTIKINILIKKNIKISIIPNWWKKFGTK